MCRAWHFNKYILELELQNPLLSTTIFQIKIIPKCCYLKIIIIKYMIPGDVIVYIY